MGVVGVVGIVQIVVLGRTLLLSSLFFFTSIEQPESHTQPSLAFCRVNICSNAMKQDLVKITEMVASVATKVRLVGSGTKV